VSVFVVDASVVVKWFVPEIHSDAARRLLVSPHEYVAPDLLFTETASTIWKKIRREELTPEEGRQLVADIGQIAVKKIPAVAGHIRLVQTFERDVQDSDDPSGSKCRSAVKNHPRPFSKKSRARLSSAGEIARSRPMARNRRDGQVAPAHQPRRRPRRQ
jgi:hypothetical protein